MLIACAIRISRNRNESPATPIQALRKLFVQERRDWRAAGAPRVGWKRGELVEVLFARSADERAEEWGDVGYYIAQTWAPLWAAYAAVTPHDIIARAVAKFDKRAR